MNKKNDEVFVSVCIPDEVASDKTILKILTLNKILAENFEYWEVLVLCFADEEMQLFSEGLLSETKNIRILQLGEDANYYKKRYVLANEAIGDIVLIAALDEIDEKLYLEVLSSLLSKKIESLKEEDLLQKKSKLIRFANSKGYSLDSIYQVLNAINILNK